MRRKISDIIFWTVIIAGVFARIWMLFYKGTFDMDVYYEWGRNTLHSGLASAYTAGYFPFQFQVFEAGAWLTEKFNTDFFTAFKAINFLFDCGIAVMLYLFSVRMNFSKNYILLYWIHPWFLLMFSHGYCDFHFTFFILLGLYLTLNPSGRNYLLSGLFIGLALMMKPQVQIVVLAIFLYGSLLFLQKKDFRVFYIFVFPAILFLDYTLYFSILTGDVTKMLRAFVSTGGAMPLTANFLNGWFPIAFSLKNPEDPIYSIMDDNRFMGLSYRAYALLILFTLLFLFIRRLNKKGGTESPVQTDLYLVAAFSTFIFPFVMTSAHENHLFLATVLLIPLMSKIKSVLPVIAIHIIFLLQAVNLYGFYGLGEGKSFNNLIMNYTLDKAFILSLVAFSAFILIVTFLLKNVPVMNAIAGIKK